MSIGTYYGMRNWVFGAVATGLILPSMPTFGQTKNSAFVNPKNSARKTIPVKTTDPPTLLAVPVSSESTSPSNEQSSEIVPTSGDKTEVQKQLEALYEQDGREPPTFNLQPLSPLGAQPQQNANPQSTNPTATTAPQGRSSQPNSLPTQKPARPTLGYTQYQPRTQATPYSVQPAASPPRNYSAAFDAQSQSNIQTQTPPQYLPQHQPSKKPLNSFFRRITGQNKYAGTQNQVPPDIHDTVPATPPASGPFAQPGTPTSPKYTIQAKTTTPLVRQVNQPVLATNTPPLQTSVQVQIISSANSIPAELAPPLLEVPALAVAPLPFKTTVEPPSLPPLMTEPQPLNVAVKPQTETKPIGQPAAEMTGEFPNPFPELTETEADKKTKPQTTKSQSTSNVALETPESTIETKAAKPITSSDVTAKTEEDPFAVKVKDFSEPSLDERLAPGAATMTPQMPKLEAPRTEAPQLESPPASTTTPEIQIPQPFNPPSNDDANSPTQLAPPSIQPLPATGATVPLEVPVDPQVEKMKRIRERFGMKGLKGFCPVTLHDERELVDARPEFHFTHRSQKFHFATAEARDKFEVSPSKYAPAAYGADVVALSRDKDVVEGTLDYAAWFKGRLYLFGTQANYDVFIGGPAKFATLAEIE